MLALSLSVYLRLRLIFYPFTRHNNLLHIYTLLCLPLGYNNIDVNVAGSKAADISSARTVQHTLHHKHAHASTEDAEATTVDTDTCVVFKGPVRSGLLTILGLNRDQDRSRLVQKCL